MRALQEHATPLLAGVKPWGAVRTYLIWLLPHLSARTMFTVWFTVAAGSCRPSSARETDEVEDEGLDMSKHGGAAYEIDVRARRPPFNVPQRECQLMCRVRSDSNSYSTPPPTLVRYISERARESRRRRSIDPQFSSYSQDSKQKMDVEAAHPTAAKTA